MKALEKYAILYNELHPFHAMLRTKVQGRRKSVRTLSRVYLFKIFEDHAIQPTSFQLFFCSRSDNRFGMKIQG